MTVFISARTESGADELARMYVDYPSIRPLLTKYVHSSRGMAQENADAMTAETDYLPTSVRVWEREV